VNPDCFHNRVCSFHPFQTEFHILSKYLVTSLARLQNRVNQKTLGVERGTGKPK